MDIDSNITIARNGDGNSRGVIIRQQAIYDVPAQDIVGHADYRGPQEVDARVQKLEICDDVDGTKTCNEIGSAA